MSYLQALDGIVQSAGDVLDIGVARNGMLASLLQTKHLGADLRPLSADLDISTWNLRTPTGFQGNTFLMSVGLVPGLNLKSTMWVTSGATWEEGMRPAMDQSDSESRLARRKEMARADMRRSEKSNVRDRLKRCMVVVVFELVREGGTGIQVATRCLPYFLPQALTPSSELITPIISIPATDCV